MHDVINHQAEIEASGTKLRCSHMTVTWHSWPTHLCCLMCFQDHIRVLLFTSSSSTEVMAYRHHPPRSSLGGLSVCLYLRYFRLKACLSKESSVVRRLLYCTNKEEQRHSGQSLIKEHH